MRRVLVVLPILLAVGCGGTPAGPGQKKIAFIKRFGTLSDPQLARLCPSLYPRDFLNPDQSKHYRYDTKDLKFRPTAQQKAAAQSAGCTSQGTKPF